MSNIKKEIGIIGLGKMGGNLSLNLIKNGWKVVGYNRTYQKAKTLEPHGLIPVTGIDDLINHLPSPRVIWLMIPSGKPVQEVIFGENGLLEFLEAGDILVDGGNSFFEDTISRAEKIEKKGIAYLDVGVSGGPEGAKSGACMMIGGKKVVFDIIEELFADTCVEHGYAYMGKSGSGHFVKMIHNGIEYGMMQAIAEGFDIMKNSKEFPQLNFEKISTVYNNGSVIESRLINWAHDGFVQYGKDLNNVSGTAGQLGEGAWTAEYADKIGVPATVIKSAVEARNLSVKNPNYQAKIITLLRHMFGGHDVNPQEPDFHKK